MTSCRLLRDPKPLVVGIGWVVDCAEQLKHVEETSHLVDLDGVNVAGINKVRFFCERLPREINKFAAPSFHSSKITC